MAVRLLVFKLAVSSSYAENIEYEAEGDDFDTVQWWLGADEAWRVRTYAVDHDIHVHHVAQPLAETLARQNTEKHYGDVLGETLAFDLAGVDDAAGIARIATQLGGRFDVAGNGHYGFWNPTAADYSTKTQPE
ncbi:hypothetical protein [Chitiniphilus eburneus]|uniref:Uncharacterized protein n=1 Tax=Chitiniphilus eburneus TaxID=2571148 RepID=A0A4U0PYA5_9NEIS|nr:hypothetical protein [Chitiniphilus eburneus]TJZ73525.1 hypothetical protein FAZ21_10045 [Chitiniphilus eburneus]